MQVTSVRGNGPSALCSSPRENQFQVGAAENVIEIVPPMGTGYVPAVVPTWVPFTNTNVIVPPVMVTRTGNPVGFVTGTVVSGTPGVEIDGTFSNSVVNFRLPSRRPKIRASADCLIAVASIRAGPPLIWSMDAMSPDRSNPPM